MSIPRIDLGYKAVLQLEQVFTVEHLAFLAERHRSVYHVRLGRVMPAAALMNWQGRVLVSDIQLGLLRIYRSPERRMKVVSK